MKTRGIAEFVHQKRKKFENMLHTNYILHLRQSERHLGNGFASTKFSLQRFYLYRKFSLIRQKVTDVKFDGLLPEDKNIE